jgi:protein N-terminal methyltransferase
VRADGFIVVKENNCSKGFHWDDQDSSITRSDNYFRWIFEQADMEVVNTQVSDVFPKELFPVRTYVLKRRKSQ